MPFVSSWPDLLWTSSQSTGLDSPDVDFPVGGSGRERADGRIAGERRAAVNRPVAANKGVFHRITLDVVGLDRAAALVSLLRKTTGRLAIAVHFVGLVGSHALIDGSRFTVAGQRELPSARRHPVSGPHGWRSGEEEAANRREKERPRA